MILARVTFLEPAMRFELMTSSLPRRRSTPELRGLLHVLKRGFNWSGRRDSNSRPSAWKADALPTELHPLKTKDEGRRMNQPLLDTVLHPSSLILAPPGAGGRIRTCVGREPAGFTARCH